MKFIILILLIFIIYLPYVKSENEGKELKQSLTLELTKYKNVSNKDWKNKEYYKEVPPFKVSGKKTSKPIIDSIDTSISSSYYKNQLTEVENLLYESVMEICIGTISSLLVEIDVYDYNIYLSDVKRITARAIGALVSDHPEYWWINEFQSGSYYYEYNGRVAKLLITLVTSYSISDINTMNEKVIRVAQTIANNADKECTIYNKLKYIHDYLITNIKYEEGDKSVSHYNIYGALVNKLCVCEGYAESMLYISRMIGIEVIQVISNTHEWNYVNIDNI
eukprot:jgi/Orpsp1_1/1177693/evm.model.c7180000062462.1